MEEIVVGDVLQIKSDSEWHLKKGNHLVSYPYLLEIKALRVIYYSKGIISVVLTCQNGYGWDLNALEIIE